MRRAVVFLAVAACATPGVPPEETTPRQATIYQSPETGTIMADRPRSVGLTLAVPPAAAWIAAKKVYADLEIPLTVENPSAHQIGNQSFYKTRQLAGQSMVDFVDCGSGMTGPKAASYRIYISLLTTIVTDGKGGTIIQTTFVPAGQDMSGNSTDRIACGSTGRLEALFLDRIKTTLGK
jgi:hypothetical protein